MRARIEEFLDNRWLLFISRLLLGGIFLTASIPKLQKTDVFINTVQSYGMLPPGLAQFYGLVVPWVELFIGFCLVFGVFTRFVAFLSIPLIASFVMASGYALFNPDLVVCGCFGEIFQLSHPASLSLDFLMLAMALVVLANTMGEGFLSIGHLLSRYYPGSGRRGRLIYDNASKLVIVALAMVVVLLLAYNGTSGTQQEELEEWLDSSLESGKPVLLFYHVGCPCVKELGMIASLEQEYGERVIFIRSGLTRVSQVVAELIENTPGMMLITGKDDSGKYIVYQQFHRTVNKNTLKDSIEQVLKSAE